MAIKWPKIFKKRQKLPAPSSDYWYMPYGATQSTVSGIKVDEQKAVTYLTVFACVSLISGDVANLPLILYRRLPGGGKERATDHPKYDLCHVSVNEEMTARSWIETELTHLLLYGNAYSLKIYNRQGQLVQIWPINNPGNVQVVREKDGRLHYKWRTSDGIEVDRTRDDVLHVPGWGFDGLIGMSPISIAREAVGLGLATEEFGQRFFGNGTHPSGLITMPTEAEAMDDDTFEAYKNSVKAQYSGLGKSHSMMFLLNGEKYQSFTMPLNDAQFLESRQFQKLEIAGMYHVPPHKIAVHGANSNYNNEEQENRHYVDSCLMSWLRRLETCKNQQILTQKERLAGYFYEFLVDGLLRGDSQARSQFYQTMIQNGVLTRNEVRAKENWNPLPDEERADETMVPLNYIFSKDAGAIPDNGMGLENEEIEEKSLIEWAKASTESKELRSITARDRISRRFRPLIVTAAQSVVNREAKAIRNQLKKLRAMRAENFDLEDWLDEFYEELGLYIKQKVGPVFDSFARAILDTAIADIGEDIDREDFDAFVDNYISIYSLRHVSSSVGQIKSLKDPEEIEVRLDEWVEKRSNKIANNETVRLSNASFQTAAFIAGFSTVFLTRGVKTCPYCQSLEGRVVSKGQSLLEDGTEIAPKGKEPMKIFGTKYHPPIHQGCDCYLGIS